MTDTWSEVIMPNLLRSVQNGEVSKVQQRVQITEVLNRWRTLNLPIMPPVPVSFHTFPHTPQGSHSPASYACVCDYRTFQYN